VDRQAKRSPGETLSGKERLGDTRLIQNTELASSPESVGKGEEEMKGFVAFPARKAEGND